MIIGSVDKTAETQVLFLLTIMFLSVMILKLYKGVVSFVRSHCINILMNLSSGAV